MKDRELEELIIQQRRNEDQSSENDSVNQNFQMKQFEKRLKTADRNQRKGNPYSDDSSDQLQQSPKQLFSIPESPKKSLNKVEEIQNKIRWKQDKEEKQQIEQLIKLSGEGAKDKKIRQLAQKIKSINLTLQKERTIRKKIEDQLNTTVRANENKIKHQQQVMTNTVKRKDEQENFKTKFNESQKKLMEMRVKNQAIKNQLNKAMRVIARQIGQSINLDDILSEQNAWKGRQQKIEKMKGRIKELQDKLQNNGINVSHMTGFTIQSMQRIQTPQSSSQLTVNSLAQNRRKQFENLKVQVQGLKSENQVLQSKIKSLTSRKLNLENEIKELKAQTQKKQKLFIEKSDNDDKYIALLKQENQKLKKQQRVVTKLVYRNDNSQANEEISNLKKEIEKFNAALLKRDEKIKQLEGQIRESNNKEIQLGKNNKILKKRLEQVEKEYVQDSKYEKQLSAAEQETIYKNWKQSKMKSMKQ